MLSGALVSREPAPGTASKLHALLAWVEVCREIELEEFREVFPVDPPERSFTWGLRLAREFSRLQAELAKSGLRFADVARGPGPRIRRTRGSAGHRCGGPGGAAVAHACAGDGRTRPVQSRGSPAARRPVVSTARRARGPGAQRCVRRGRGGRALPRFPGISP